jgi:large subunit ribosomal protein L30
MNCSFLGTEEEMDKDTSSPKKLRITYVKSAIGYSWKHKETIKAMGFKHLNDSIVKRGYSFSRGMLRKVNHLVKVEELAE